jgi:hypothetical protein
MQLTTLIQRLLGRTGDNSSPVGSETDQWQANRDAEKLSDPLLLTEIESIISDNQDAEERRMCYRLFGFIASNSEDATVIERLLVFLPNEKNEDALYELFMAVNDAGLEYNSGTEAVAYWADDLNEMVRNASIRALGKSKEHEKAEAALIELLEDPYDDYGIRYAADSLYKVGSKKALPILKKKLKEASDDEALESIQRTLQKLS